MIDAEQVSPPLLLANNTIVVHLVYIGHFRVEKYRPLFGDQKWCSGKLPLLCIFGSLTLFPPRVIGRTAIQVPLLWQIFEFVTWMSSSRRAFGANAAVHGANADLGPFFFAIFHSLPMGCGKRPPNPFTGTWRKTTVSPHLQPVSTT